MNSHINENITPEPRPWYKEPWLWLVILLPVAAVVAGISTVIIAYKHADDLVNDDYYKVGISINRNIDSEKLAAKLGLHGKLFFSGKKIQLQLQTEKNSSELLPQKLMLEFFHPTLKSKDFSVEINKVSSGFYEQSFSMNSQVGRYYLRITPHQKEWTFKQEIVVAIGEPINLDVR